MTGSPASSRLTRLSRAVIPAAPLTLAALPSAHGQIVYTNPVDITFSVNNAVTFYVGTVATTDTAIFVPSGSNRTPAGYTFYMAFSGGSSSNPYVWTPTNQTRVLSNGTIPFDGNAQVSVLTAGTLISATPASGKTWADGSSYSFLNSVNSVSPTWTPGTTGYLGLKLNNGADYGWLQVSYNADQTLTIYDFAYESSGGSIVAGDTGMSAVPEPGDYALITSLLAGAAALYSRRSRKKVAA